MHLRFLLLFLLFRFVESMLKACSFIHFSYKPNQQRCSFRLCYLKHKKTNKKEAAIGLSAQIL